MIEIKKVRTRGKRTRLNKSYPRTKINRLGGDRVAHKQANYYKGNWDDDNFAYLDNHLARKFLRANVGRPINKVYSEFLERCTSSAKTEPLKDWFYGFIEEKSELDWTGGFYVTNGILNYKKRTKRPASQPYKWFDIEAANRAIFKDIHIRELVNKAEEINNRIYLGEFWFSYPYRKVKVYIVRRSLWDSDEMFNLTFKFKTCRIEGLGDFITTRVFKSMTKLEDKVYSPFNNYWGIKFDEDYLYIIKTV